MQIDRAYLEATVANLKRQNAEAREVVAQTEGALIFADALLLRLQEEAPIDTLPEPVTGPTEG